MEYFIYFSSSLIDELSQIFMMYFAYLPGNILSKFSNESKLSPISKVMDIKCKKIENV